ncbi:MAG: YciI family protein [Micrococcales bacterium]|nr:YciI family protein [Micrococcales bacterium]
MSQYLLSVHHDFDNAYDEGTDLEQVYADVGAFNTALTDSGAYRFAGGLMPGSSAKVVDARAGEAVTTDGPYLESKELLGGFWVIDVADDAAALDWAARGSAACRQKVEVRPFQPEG